jgi:hypothetical protein
VSAPRIIRYAKAGRPPVCCAGGCRESGTVYWHRLRWCSLHLPAAARKELKGEPMREVTL